MAQLPHAAGVLARLPAGTSADRLAISSWCWAADYYAGRFSLLDLPARAAALGYTAVELNDFMLPPPRFSRVARPLFSRLPYAPADLWRYRRAVLYLLRDRLAAHGLRCAGWTLNTDFTQPALALPAQALYRGWGIWAANALGAGTLRVTLGGRHNGDVAGVADRLAVFTRAALRRLKRNTLLVLENHWGMSSKIETHCAIFAAARDRLAASERARFALCLDPTNMADDDRPAAWRRMAPDAGHVHLKGSADRPSSNGRPVDTATLLRALTAAGFAGTYVVEGDQ